jgi:hypothetical protein
MVFAPCCLREGFSHSFLPGAWQKDDAIFIDMD